MQRISFSVRRKYIISVHGKKYINKFLLSTVNVAFVSAVPRSLVATTEYSPVSDT